MPRSKTSLRQLCASCAGRITCAEADAFCHGCGLIICEECTLDYSHDGFYGNHGLKDPKLKFCIIRSDNMRERDRRPYVS